MSIATLWRGIFFLEKKISLFFSDVEWKNINLLPICFQHVWPNSVLCVRTIIFTECFFLSLFFVLDNNQNLSPCFQKNFDGVVKSVFIIGVQRNNLRRKMSFVERIQVFCLSLSDIEQKIFRCLLNFFRMSIGSAFYLSIGTLTCEEIVREKNLFCFLFRTLSKSFWFCQKI